MRKYYFWLGIALLFAVVAYYAVNPSDKNKEFYNFQKILDSKDYFNLESKFLEYKSELNTPQITYYEAFLANAFNKNQRAVELADSILFHYLQNFSDTALAALMKIKIDSYFKLGNYKQAAIDEIDLLTRYKSVMDSNEIENINNHFLICNGLKEVPPQETFIPGNDTIEWKKDRLGLVEIPLMSHGQTFGAIFDTRANISSISQTYAEKLGLKILNTHYEEKSGLTGIGFKTGLGVADSLFIGNILVRKVVFQIMPDSVLYVAPLKFSLNIIIGFPVIEQLGEVHIRQDGKMIIPKYQTKSKLHNLALDGLDPVIRLRANDDTLCFHFDLGADKTQLYSTYFELREKDILKKAKKHEAKFGGAGGIITRDIFSFPDFSLSLGGKTIILDSVDVRTDPIFPGEKYFGNIGQDFAYKFNELVINFGYMYVEGH